MPAGNAPSRHAVGKLVTKIGEKAGVIVNAVDGKTATPTTCGGPLAPRWAERVMPAVLQKLDASCQQLTTTMGFYVDLDADDMADDLWAKHPARRPVPCRPVTLPVTLARLTPLP